MHTLAWGRIDPGLVVAWVAVAAAWLVAVARARPHANGAALAGMPGLATMGVAAWVFVARGGHPTSQLSASDAWSLWTDLWPALVLANAIAAVVALVGAFRAGFGRGAPWFLALALDLFAALATFENFPSA
ncbi:MAG: hypothetical protein JNM10_06995 [Planctomycetia bacterium]|nr:hypothetical protein [Planctomycetia bacterium]